MTVLTVAIIASSCSITKRTYNDGYHVEWHHSNHTPEPAEAADKTEDPGKEIIEAISVSKNSLHKEEGRTSSESTFESSPIKENKLPVTDRSNTVKFHPVSFVKNSVHQITKQAAQVKEKSSQKGMGMLNSLLVIILAVIVLVLIILVVTVLL